MDAQQGAEEIERLLRTAKLHQMRQSLEEASAVCRQALELDPNNADAIELMGDLLVARGELEAGLEHYQRAMRLQPRASTEEKVARLALRIAEEKRRAVPPDAASTPATARRVNPSTACALSVLWPGLGQVYNGEHTKGLILFAVALIDFIVGVVVATPHVRALRSALLGSGGPLGAPVPALLWFALLVWTGLWLYALVDASLTATAIGRGEGPGSKSGWEV